MAHFFLQRRSFGGRRLAEAGYPAKLGLHAGTNHHAVGRTAGNCGAHE